MINLTIKTLDSQNHKFNVPDTFTILELKEHIAEQVNIPVVQQRLIFCGRVLSNETKLADIGIDGKVMHLVQKIPRLATTTTGSSSSTTTNTNSRSGPGFRGWHSHGLDPSVVFGAIGIPTNVVQGDGIYHADLNDLPRIINARNQGTHSRLLLATDMIRRANDVLSKLENPRSGTRSSAADVEQFPEGLQQTDTSGNIPESSSPPLQTDPDSVNVSYEVDETFPNTVVVTIDATATHTMRMPPLVRQMHNRLAGTRPSENATEQNVESEALPTTPTVSNNQSSAEQATESLPSSATTEQNLRSTSAANDRRRFKEVIDKFNRLRARLEPFYAQYCHYVIEDPHFESAEGDNGSNRAQTIFHGVSEVMHFISHIYHALSDLRFGMQRPPPRHILARAGVLQGAILHHHQTFTTSATSSPPPPPLSTQQPTSTQTTTTDQSIPVAPTTLGVDSTNPGEEESPNVSTSATENNTAVDYSSETPHGVELMFDLTPGSIRIDSVETSFVNPSGSSQPPAVSQPSSGNETSNNSSPDWMDQMIDVISSGVRRPFMANDQALDWGSIPTTSTRTPRVTPRTTDSSSTTNSPSQSLPRLQWDTPRVDPFLPCNSHHFEATVRPLVIASRRSAQGTGRSTTSANSGSSTTDTSTTTPPPIEVRPFPVRRSSRQRTRFVQESADGLLAGIHPIITWSRNRNNAATTSASNSTSNTLQNTGSSDVGGIRAGMADASSDYIGPEIDLDRARALMGPNIHPSLVTSNRTVRIVDDLLHTVVGNIPYFLRLRGRYVVFDLFLLITGNWTLLDVINFNTHPESTIVRNPLNENCDAIINFVLERIMRNQIPDVSTIEAAANRLYQEILPYLNIFQCSVPIRSTVNVNESFLRCIKYHLRALVLVCERNRGGASNPNDILLSLREFAVGFLSLVVYCCTNRSIFRLCVIALVQFSPLPAYLHTIVLDEIRYNIDRYWTNMSDFRVLNLSVVDYIVPCIDGDAHTSRVVAPLGNNATTIDLTLPSPEIIDEPDVVIGSQEWHHNVPSEWVPVITRDSQRQRRQGTQPPYSDAYLSGMPNKRRKVVTNSKSQGPLSQIIAKNLEVAMGAAGVTIKKEVTASVGADTEVQSAYTERIRTFGRSGLDTHPDFCPNRYPNASKFFYDHNHPN